MVTMMRVDRDGGMGPSSRRECSRSSRGPVVKSAVVANPELKSLGNFKADTLNVGELARTTAQAQKVFDRAGYR